MKELNIDLGEKIESPTSLAGAQTDSPEKPSKHYPALYLSGKEVEGLPDEGQLLITYCIRRQTVTKGDGGKQTSVDLEVRSIDGVEGDDDSGEKKSPSDEFESRMKSHLASKDEGDDQDEDY